MSRLFMCTKDVQYIIGKGRTAAAKLIGAIKAKTNKTRFDQITAEEFSAHTGIALELIIARLS